MQEKLVIAICDSDRNMTYHVFPAYENPSSLDTNEWLLVDCLDTHGYVLGNHDENTLVKVINKHLEEYLKDYEQDMGEEPEDWMKTPVIKDYIDPFVEWTDEMEDQEGVEQGDYYSNLFFDSGVTRTI